MQKLISVTNSDTINLYGDRFTIGALVQGTHDACLLGIPTLYNHDFSKPIGWSLPLGIHFEPGLSRSTAIVQLPETKDDRNYLFNIFNYYYKKEIIEPNSASINKLKTLLSDCLEGNEEIIIGEAVALFEKDLVKRKFPEIFSLLDKDGLIPLEDLEPVAAGIFKKGDFLLFANSYLRRSFCARNTLNYSLLKKLSELNHNKVEVKISIDENLIGLADAYFGERMELEYWWGPKFDDNLAKIPNGITRHEADEFQRSSLGISRTEFRWGNLSGMKVFEVEELRDIPSDPLKSEKYGCRYAHAMVNIETGSIEHLDGAIRSYTEDEIIERLDTDLARAPRNTEYKKLWRIDGEIDVPTWKSLISDYFRNNPLIGEYLGAEDKTIKNRKIIESSREKSIKELYVPFSMSKDSGIRIALSFTPREQIPDKEFPTVIPLDNIFDGENTIMYVETLALEIKKILGAMGVKLEISQDISFVSFKDAYVNFPLIYICKNIETNIEAINTALKKLIGFLQEKFEEMFLVLKFGFPIDAERIALISVMGPISSINAWLDTELSIVPHDYIGLRRWTENVGEYLQRYKSNFDSPPLTEVFMPTGVLLFNRKRIDAKKFKVEYSEEIKSHTYEIEFNEEDNLNMERLLKENIKPTIGFLIKRSQCTKCKLNYKDCYCSKIMEEEVSQEILEATPFPFWTDKSRLF